MFLAGAVVVFSVFFVNVAMGAFADASFLGDVGEMLVLSCASLLFVVAILKKEAERSSQDDSNQT